MVGQKRSELLSEKEIERLITRRDMKDTKKRIANDARVKKKLSAWNDNLDHVALILENLPAENIDSAIEERNIFQLLNIVSDLLLVKKFRRVSGETMNIDSWQTAPSRPAEDLDIARAAIMAIFFKDIYRYIGADNPVLRTVGLLPVYVDPIIRDRLTNEEKSAVEKCLAAVKEVYGFDLTDMFSTQEPPL